ncbi:MAG: T9SS C-terminal target domain-containing protein [Gemmatimonadetes bacterium]|nr:MAG: T9SS C-terminal target domain-containing protein [Gemmatimonadota bacterium]
MPRLRVFVVLLALFLGVNFAQAEWLPLSSSTPAVTEIEVLRSDLNSTRLRVELSGVELSTVPWFGSEYTEISMPNTPHTSQEGAPKVPMLSTAIALPPTAGVELIVRPGQYETLTGKDVLPYSDYTHDPEKWVIDGDIYNTDAFYPAEIARVQSPQIMRDIRYAPLQIFPIQVNPMTQEVRIYTELEIEIRTRGTNGVNAKTTYSAAPSPAFEKIYQNRFVNYESIKPYLFPHMRVAPEGLNLLIISPDALAGALAPYVEWKNKKGIRTYVAPFSETGSSRNQIKTYIQNLYDNPDTRPEYLLFIGDANVFPGWNSTGYLGDNPYGYLEGDDEVLDIFMGRYPCTNSPLSLLTMVNRTIEYEQDIVNDGSGWNKKATLICPQASSQSIKFNRIGQELLVDLGGYTEINEFSGFNGGNEVIQLLNNEGQNFLNYRGSISNYGVTPDRVDPQGKYPFVTWLTCSTCNYATTDLCVQWMRDGSSTTPEGAIAAIGGSQVTTPEPYARRRDALDKGMYEGMFEQGLTHLGEIVLWGKENILIEYPRPDMYTDDTYNHFALMGDPTVEIRTDGATDLQVEHQPIMPFGMFDYVVTVRDNNGEPLAGATVALTGLDIDEDVFYTATTDENGEAILHVMIDQLGDYDLVVTSQNSYPYMGTVRGVPGMAFEGVVTNSETGAPVPARVSVEGGYYAFADVETGFYRLYVPEEGTYQLLSERWGYYDYLSQELTITDGDTLTLDIVMNPYPSGTISGHVRDMAMNPVEGAMVIARQEVDQPPVYTDAEGYYEIIAPGSYTYDLYVEHPDHAERTIQVQLPIGENVVFDFRLASMENFEEDDGGFYEVSPFSDWEHGTPTAEGGPAEAYSGENVWGTVLNAPYHPARNSVLYTPEFYIAPDPDIDYHLQFHHWYEINEDWDGGNVQISTDGGNTWDIVIPEGGYPDESVVGLGAQPGYTGVSDGWQQARFNLSDYAGEWVQIRFRFGVTNSAERYRGWFIDRFVIYGSEEEPPGLFTVSGHIRYQDSDTAVPNTHLTLGAFETTSNADGLFNFTEVPLGDYTLAAQKEASHNGISSFDAARILQYAVGSYEFDEYQIRAADVTGDGGISPFDAARVAQFAAGIEQSSATGTWQFLPEAYSYTPLNINLTDQDFNAILMGEVTGNWTPGSQQRMKQNEPEIAANAEVKQVGNQLQLTHFVDEVLAFQFTLQADPLPKVRLPESAGADWQLLVQQHDEYQWIVVAYGATPLPTETLFILDGLVGLPQVEILDGQINETPAKVIPAVNLPQKVTLHAAYPNPFNPKTTLAFDLPQSSHVRLTIYDVSGHLVTTLVEGEREAGYHQVKWNGTNDQNQAVGSGLYFYRLETSNEQLVNSMLLLR